MRPEDDPDVQRMLAVQKRDDREAFEALFRKHVRQVTGFATSFVGSRARAEEIAQEAFVQIYRTRRSYRPRARFSTWLYRIVTNLCVSEVRRAEHRFRPPAAREGGEESAPPVREVADPEQRSGEDDLLVKEDVARFRALLDRLPAQQRAALLLARVEGHSYDEVARSLRCSVSAVKSLIHRATVTLREGMREED